MQRFTLRPPVLAAPGDRSFWLQDIGADAITAPLSGDAQADIAIVGGGYAGLWTALRLREQAPDLSITLLEADFCGSGASGRNGGQVHSWFAEIDLLAHVVGRDEALDLCRATADAIDELDKMQRDGLINMDLALQGWMWTASSRAQEGAWDAADTLCRRMGEYRRLRPLDGAEIRRRTGSDVSYTGVVEDRAGTVQPAKLAVGLRALALARGIVIHEKSPVVSIECDTSKTGVVMVTPAGRLRASKAVLTTNAWLSSIPEIRRHMFVVDSQIIATEPAAEALDRMGWGRGLSICDSQAHVLYYQRTATDRVIWGRGTGHVAFGGHVGAWCNRSADGGADNIRELKRVYPALAGVQVTHDWTGPIDCMAEHLPVFGHLTGAPNILFGGGFNGTGIAQTPVAGRILASLALGLDDRWSRSGLVGLGKRGILPPEPLRYLGARVVRKAIRLRNDAEIVNRAPSAIVRMLSELKPGHGGPVQPND